MQRIVHLCTDFWPAIGGIENFVTELATKLNRCGYESEVICFDRIKNSSNRLPGKAQLGTIAIRRVSVRQLALLQVSAVQRFSL